MIMSLFEHTFNICVRGVSVNIGDSRVRAMAQEGSMKHEDLAQVFNWNY